MYLSNFHLFDFLSEVEAESDLLLTVKELSDEEGYVGYEAEFFVFRLMLVPFVGQFPVYGQPRVGKNEQRRNEQ